MPPLLLHRVYPFIANVAIPSTKRPWKPLVFPKEQDWHKMHKGTLHEKTPQSLAVC